MSNRFSIRIITEIGVAVALAYILDFFKVWRAPQGGSITIAIVPLLIIALRWGIGPGMVSGALFGILKLFTGYIVHPVQALLDYPLAFMVIGLAGIFFAGYKATKGRHRLVYLGLGVLVGFGARLLCHILSGVIFFGHYAPEGTPALLYSFLYNITFIAPEAVVTFLVLTSLTYYRFLQAKNV